MAKKKLLELGFDKIPNFAAAGPAAVTHPAVRKTDPEFGPGWNASSTESGKRKLFSCVVIFDRRGRMVFKGRSSYEGVKARVDKLLRSR